MKAKQFMEEQLNRILKGRRLLRGDPCYEKFGSPRIFEPRVFSRKHFA
jgi:hypothetical protein